MKRYLFLTAAVLAIVITLPLSADAALIFQRTVIGGTGASPPGVLDSAILSLGLDSPSDTMLFEGITLTAANEGQTFVATSASDPHFDAFVTTITDGAFLTSNLIRVCHAPPRTRRRVDRVH